MVMTSIFFNIPGDSSGWVDRIDAACEVVQRIFPWGEISNPAIGRKARNRRTYLQRRMKHSAFLFDLNNGIESYINGHCYRNPNYVGVSGRFNLLGQAPFRLAVHFESASFQECEPVMTGVGEVTNAYNSAWIPPESYKLLRAYNGIRLKSPHLLSLPDYVAREETLSDRLGHINKSLPVFDYDLNCASYQPPVPSCQPMKLGWLNYWSKCACEFLGFPDYSRDVDILPYSYQTASGNWLVKLTQEPLALDRDDHLAVYADVSARFPGIGRKQ